MKTVYLGLSIWNLLIILGCKQGTNKDTNLGDISINCEKVFVIDTNYKPVICFLLSVRNNSSSDKLLANNYFQSGNKIKNIFSLKDTVLSNLTILLGSTLHSRNFIVKPKESRKILLVCQAQLDDTQTSKGFSNMISIYGNKYNGNWYPILINNLQLNYNGSRTKNDDIISQDYQDSDEVEEAISINKTEPEIVYFDKLSLEDANKYVQ